MLWSVFSRRHKIRKKILLGLQDLMYPCLLCPYSYFDVSLMKRYNKVVICVATLWLSYLNSLNFKAFTLWGCYIYLLAAYFCMQNIFSTTLCRSTLFSISRTSHFVSYFGSNRMLPLQFWFLVTVLVEGFVDCYSYRTFMKYSRKF